MPDLREPVLAVEDIVSGYGKKRVVGGVSLAAYPGEIVGVIGHNGSGKSTLLKAIFGLAPVWSGAVKLDGATISPKPRDLIRASVAFAPQGRGVFFDLSVAENLDLGAVSLEDKRLIGKNRDRVMELFPGLKEDYGRKAGNLSGGRKQMLSIGATLMSGPRLLLLDEPSLGLAQKAVKEMLAFLNDINAGSGTTLIIVEQKVRELIAVADTVYVLRNGAVSYSGKADDLRDEKQLRDVYF